MPEAGGRRVTEAIAALAAGFRSVGIESADTDARLLVLTAARLSRLDLLRDPGLLLDANGELRLNSFCRRRLAREPVSRILGRREFWSLELEVTPAVLDPRPDTETLVEVTLDHVRRVGLDQKPIRILDLGTGSGAILVALLHELPAAFGIGVDRSLDALLVAHRNAERAGVGDRAAFLQGDWASAIARRVDIIVSNPPYLATAEIGETEPEVGRFDPGMALDGGIDGLAAYRRIMADWQRLGHPPLMLEVGAGQAPLLREMVNKNLGEFARGDVEILPDLAGKERIVTFWPQNRFPG